MEDDDENMSQNCPECGHEYDEIDYEYQICSYCGFTNDNNREPDEPDMMGPDDNERAEMQHRIQRDLK